MKLRILGFTAISCALLSRTILADGNDLGNQVIAEDAYPSWTQVHFEVEPGTWATIAADEKSERITSLIFSFRGKRFEIPKPCLDDLHDPVLETARIGFSPRGSAWVEFKTTVFDENGNGQDEKDMTVVRFTVAEGALAQREIIQEKNNYYTSRATVDLSKGLSKSDIGANRCGTSGLMAEVKVK